MAHADAFSGQLQHLQRCVRDLIVSTARSAELDENEPSQFATSVATSLLSMLDADFLHVALEGKDKRPGIQITRTAAAHDGLVEAVQAEVSASLRTRSMGQTADMHFLGIGELRLACARIGLAGDSMLVVGSHHADFPTQVQRLLLYIGANEIAIGLRRWHAETDKRRLSALLNRSPDFIGLANLDGIAEYVNPAGLQLVGLEGLEAVGPLHILDFIAPEDRKRVRDELWPLVIREKRWAGEVAFHHFKSGGTIPFLNDWFVIDDMRTGLPIGIATISRDLSARKRLEAELRDLGERFEHRFAEQTVELAVTNRRRIAEVAQRQHSDTRSRELQSELFHAARLSAVGQMAAALAHEINQPLAAATNSINAARRLLDKEKNTLETVREVMGEAAEQLARAGQIIRRLRDFVKRGETERRVESVTTIVEEAAAFALAGSAGLDVELSFGFDPNAAEIFCDRVQIQQVIANLMRNAIEAMVVDPQQLTVKTALLEHEMIEITVADNGPGVPPDVADRLFEPFVSTKPNGLGLGLSICRSIIENHGGTLWSESNRGGGTVFHLTLAAAPVERDANAG